MADNINTHTPLHHTTTKHSRQEQAIRGPLKASISDCYTLILSRMLQERDRDTWPPSSQKWTLKYLPGYLNLSCMLSPQIQGNPVIQLSSQILKLRLKLAFLSVAASLSSRGNAIWVSLQNCLEVNKSSISKVPTCSSPQNIAVPHSLSFTTRRVLILSLITQFKSWLSLSSFLHYFQIYPANFFLKCISILSILPILGNLKMVRFTIP